GVPHFRVVFDLERFPAPRVVAWAPFEAPRLGRVKLERFRYRDGNDVLHDLGPDDLACHGCSQLGDCHVFATVPPRLCFAPTGGVSTVEGSGRLEPLGPVETFGRLTAALAEKQATIEQLTRRVEALRQNSSVLSRLRGLFK